MEENILINNDKNGLISSNRQLNKYLKWVKHNFHVIGIPHSPTAEPNNYKSINKCQKIPNNIIDISKL